MWIALLIINDCSISQLGSPIQQGATQAGKSTESQAFEQRLGLQAPEYSPPAAPTPVACGPLGGLTECFQLPPFDSVSVPETSTDLFCFGNPQGTWYLKESNSPLLPQFSPPQTSLCGSTTMTLTAPANKTGQTQDYTAIPMIGQNGASTAEVDIHVPAHCPCYALQIYTAAQRHDVPPFLLAAIAARESGGFPPTNDPLCGSMDPLHNGTGIGLDGTGHGLFQIDQGSWFFATTPGVKDPNQNADVAAIIFADDLAANQGNVKGALHDYNAGPDKAIPTTGNYEAGVLAYEQDFLNENYSFACVTKQVSRIGTLYLAKGQRYSFVQTMFRSRTTDEGSSCS